MKYLNLTKQFAAVAIASLLFAACSKEKQPQPMGDAGQTLVKLLHGGTPAGIIKDPVDFVNTPKTLTVGVIDIRRDVPNNEELMKTMTVVIKDDTSAVSFFNRDTCATRTVPACKTASNPDYKFYYNLNPAWYTIEAADGVIKSGGSGGTWTFTFKPGEFAKQIYITIPDATKLDPNLLYAVPFSIVSVDAGGKISASKTVMVEIGAKNKYDGRYQMKSRHHRSPYTFPIDTEMHMVTTGASTVRFYWPDAANYGHPIGVGPGNDLSWYGATMSPAVVFDPATNLVTDVYNAGGTTQIRLALPPAAPVSRFEEATKTMYVYWYYFTGTGQDFSNRGWSDTLYYIGSR